MDLAPIVLFVYNRPWHTKQTLDSLANNTFAKESIIYIYCDGAKVDATKETLHKIEETRAIVKQENRFKTVSIIEQPKNIGLANSIINGVTQIVEKHGTIIVLEDDIVTSTGFLKYMNEALHIYNNTENVMHISGYMFPVKNKLPETFFIKPTSCWGWATWKRAWKHFEKNVDHQIKSIEERKGWKEFTIGYSFPSFKNQLESNRDGRINSWAIFWYASVFLNEGTSLHPYPSLVQNIGFDGTGENFNDKDAKKSPYFWPKLAQEITVSKVNNFNNLKAYNQLKRFFKELSTLDRKLTIRDKFYLFRQNSTLYLKNVYKVVFIPKSIEINDNSTKYASKKFSEIKRYTKGTLTLLGKPFEYADFASFKFIHEELFQTEIYKFHTNNSTPYIIDAGANIGLSIVYFKTLYPNAEIVAFEPDDHIFKILQKNVASFQFENIKLIKKGLWNEETTLSFFSEGADGGRIATAEDNKKLIQIETVRLREFLNRPVDFLKIDIEGAETTVLTDCIDLLSNVERVFVEYHSFVYEPQNLHTLLSTLSTAGFRYYLQHIGIYSTRPFVKLESFLGMDLQLNIYAFKKQKE
jgi:FkbM family methyltransferase